MQLREGFAVATGERQGESTPVLRGMGCFRKGEYSGRSVSSARESHVPGNEKEHF